MKNFSQNSVKIALCGVVGSERTYQRVWETSQQAKSVRRAIARTGRFTEKGTRFLCLLRNLSFSKYGKEGKGMERKRQIKDGHIVVKNPLYQEMPKQEVAIKSGRTLYRFTGSYDGERSLPHKVLRLMGQEKAEKDVEE